MQQDNNHIEDKLRQLENQQLPDLSNMDKHWQDMQQMLAAGVNQKNIEARSFVRYNLKRFFLAAAVITAVIFSGWFYKNFQQHKEKTNIGSVAKTKTTTSNIKTGEKVFQDATQNTSTTDVTQSQIDQPTITPAPGLEKNDMVTTAEKQNNNNATIKIAQNPVAVSLKAEDSKEMVGSFFSKIQKPVQEFTINADEGAQITAKEGTVFSIPPSAFVDENGKIVSGNVKIMIEEFYKYSDMVAANLTTTSNGKQLLTGGMVKIMATINGTNLLNLRSNREINLLMPTKTYDPGMELFLSGDENGNKNETNIPAMYAVMNRNINWDLNGSQSGFPVYDSKTNFPDHLDQPYNVIKTGKKNIAKFALSRNSSLTTDQMEKILIEKYGNKYDIIKVKGEDGPEKALNFWYRGTLEKQNVIGDSVRLTLEQAFASRYIEKNEVAFYAERIKQDSLLYIKRFIANKFLCSLSTEYKDPYKGIYINTKNMSPDSLDKIFNDYITKQSAYSFAVKQLGWINCDKFSHYSNTTNFVVNLPADVKADKFVSQVVFTSTRSVMPGRTNNNQIGFHNIPANMGVYVVGLGERNGKMVSFMQKLTVGKAEVSINDLQETTPEAFRKKIAELDMN